MKRRIFPQGPDTKGRLYDDLCWSRFGAFLRESLRHGGVDDRFVATLPGRPSGMSVAISDATGDYGAVIVSGTNLEIDPDRLKGEALWTGASLLLLQNEIPAALNLAAARAARAQGVRVCLNAAPYRPLAPELAALVDVLVVNALEAEALSNGVRVDDLRGADAAARQPTRGQARGRTGLMEGAKSFPRFVWPGGWKVLPPAAGLNLLGSPPVLRTLQATIVPLTDRSRTRTGV
jgi:sugar/nucleoside kinase (ribokinase family)